jgi:2-polyprenyl-3-methyl-5-hydroxy-6-metoxy-1,4-benzoquinol methylase
MPGCCSTDYRRFFNRKFAARDLERYRKRGLSKTERDLVELVGDVVGASVLEAGGGIGALQLELLEAGAKRTTNIELSAGYEDVARELFAGREVERRIGDFATEEIPSHDIVLMHRVVCCYPDPDALTGAAAARARRVLALTLPQERRWIGWGLRIVNAWLRVRRCGFRTYQHPFATVVAAAEREGLMLEHRIRRGLFWESAAFVR